MHNSDLTSTANVKALLEQYSAKAKKRFGQNFLVNANVLNKILSAAAITKNDTVLEVGPGLGVLTKELAKTAKKVISVEKDWDMASLLSKTLKNFKNVEIVTQDILRYQLPTKPYHVVANIPYYLTSPLMRRFLESKNPPKAMVLMVQKEVAQRICSKPPDMSLLAVSVQWYAACKIISYVSKESFWPAPNVDSAVIKIVPHEEKSKISEKLFFTAVKAGFLHPRKQLANNLAGIFKRNRQEIEEVLLRLNIDPRQRAETLNVAQWETLARELSL